MWAASARRARGTHQEGNLLDLLLLHVWEGVLQKGLQRRHAGQSLEGRHQRVANLSKGLDEGSVS